MTKLIHAHSRDNAMQNMLQINVALQALLGLSRAQDHFLHGAVNMLFNAVKLGILTSESIGIDSLLQPAMIT